MSVVQKAPKIGSALLKERKKQRLTLEQVSAQSGVSKSMLSQIERGEANPTFAVVWSLTQALKIDFGTLAGGHGRMSLVDEIAVTSRPLTPVIQNADGKCLLRILSEPRLAGVTEWYDVQIDVGGSLDSAPHASGAFEHFTALTDGIEIKCGNNATRLSQGETARYAGDVPHSITNVGTAQAKGFLVVLYR